jgi:hypothetical protein
MENKTALEERKMAFLAFFRASRALKRMFAQWRI